MYQIYKITNTINGKSYIGKTKSTYERRFREHLAESKRERAKKRPLYRAINKYGVDVFTIELLEETDAPIERERYWIEFYGTYGPGGYNATKGGDGREYVDYEKIIDCLFENNFDHVVVSKILKHDRDTVIYAAKAAGIYIPIVRRVGEDKSQSKLTTNDVIKIRELYVPKKYGKRRISKLLGLPLAAVNCVISGKTWKHIITPV